jgi:16S rRNA (guanine(966)-N(2))-methyltransferase RsmD
MRITGGIYKSRRIDAKIPSGVRPTLDMTKESIFNTLNNIIDFEGCKVLDICAGTGSLGFESLSRGADFCLFIEKNKKVVDFIREVANNLKIDKKQYKIISVDALRYIKNPGHFSDIEKFDLIFTDPPYNLKILDDILKGVLENNLLISGGYFIIEHNENLGIAVPEMFEIVKSKKYGSTFVEILTI